jgi:basic amino acid/polyamine antiporter, APA family
MTQMKSESSAPANVRRLLHPLSAVALIVGIVIGAGIFKTPSLVAGISGDAGWALVLWLAGALISIVGALCYAELCTTYPNAGGDYHFLAQGFWAQYFIHLWLVTCHDHQHRLDRFWPLFLAIT